MMIGDMARRDALIQGTDDGIVDPRFTGPGEACPHLD
jgi:hypothetical protein